jgi:putative ABC transport system substrate-binding protein
MGPASPPLLGGGKVGSLTYRGDRMRRRTFLGGFTALLACSAKAQVPTKPALIAFLWGGSPDTEYFQRTFGRGLRELGYIEGRDYVVVLRGAEGVVSRLPLLAQELVSLRPDVIVASNGTVAVYVKRATSEIPIVSPLLSSPESFGLIASRARPGGNVTGILGANEEHLMGKQLALIRELVPASKRIGVLTTSQFPTHAAQRKGTEIGAAALLVELVFADVQRPDDIEGAIATLATSGVGAILVFGSALLALEQRRIAAVALSARLPTMFSLRNNVDAGGLMSYGVSQPENDRQAMRFVDKILKGAKPAELPVEMPAKFELVINLKTAKALGLTIPDALLFSADEVIE